MVLLSILAFLCLPTGSHDENVDCPHLYQVLTWTEMGSYTLIDGVLKYFLFWGFCLLWFSSLGAFVLWCFCPFCFFSVRPCDHMTRILIVYTCIIWSHEQKWDRKPWFSWRITIFSILGVLSALIFIFWFFCPMVLLSILVYFCPPTSSHDENVDCPHLYHVIIWTEIGLYKLIVWVHVFKYFVFWGFCSL